MDFRHSDSILESNPDKKYFEYCVQLPSTITQVAILKILIFEDFVLEIGTLQGHSQFTLTR